MDELIFKKILQEENEKQTELINARTDDKLRSMERKHQKALDKLQKTVISEKKKRFLLIAVIFIILHVMGYASISEKTIAELVLIGL